MTQKLKVSTDYHWRMRHLLTMITELCSQYTPPPQADTPKKKMEMHRRVAEEANRLIPNMSEDEFRLRLANCLSWVLTNHEHSRS